MSKSKLTWVEMLDLLPFTTTRKWSEESRKAYDNLLCLLRKLDRAKVEGDEADRVAMERVAHE